MATKKTTTKKKASAPKAGASRPSFKVDAAANAKLTERRTKWFGKFPVGNTKIFVLPPLDGSGILYPLTSLHYKVMAGNSKDDGMIAPACLQVHGDGNCYICKFIEWCKAQADKHIVKIGKDLYPNSTCNCQAFVYDGGLKEWIGPKIIKLPKTVSSDMAILISTAEQSESPMFCDPEHGQSLVINRVGTGQFDTKYKCMSTGQPMNLNKVIPDWFDKAFKNLASSLDIHVLTAAEQKERLVVTFRDLPWDQIDEEIG